ncbi:MAG: efflux RND transporter permease subunit, partial [Acidobacteriota bacterium]
MTRRRRESTIFYRELRALCGLSYRYAGVFLLVALLISIPAALEVRELSLDTDLTRLLPEHSRAVQWSEELEPAVGDGGYFSIIFEDDDRAAVESTVDEVAARLLELPGIRRVNHQYPRDFIDEYRYLLVPSRWLEEVVDEIVVWEAEVNPFLEDLGDPPEEDADGGDELERVLEQFGDIPRYHEGPEGRMFGMLVHPDEGLKNLGAVRDIYQRMEAIVAEVAERHDISWWGIGGSARTRVEEFDIIKADLRRSGTIAVIAIIAALVFSFRSIRVLPVVLLPLGVGLLWSFALVPTLVGELNTITSFPLMVLFGMGVDYSIHLVKRFRAELVHARPQEALCETFTSTGRSVATSGATTCLGLWILAVSDFRGFSDFGIIGGTSVFLVVLAMLLVMPATLVLAHRLGLVTPRAPGSPRDHFELPPRWVAVTLAVLVIASAGLAPIGLSFDYDFTSLSASLEELERIRAKQDEVYPVFFGPAAIYLTEDEDSLDVALERIEASRQGPDSHIGAVSSIRDLAPGERELQRRLELIAEIKEMLSARWVRRIDDPQRQRVIADILEFEPPARAPAVHEVPDSLAADLRAHDDSGYLVALNPQGNTKDGLVAMAFTAELYELDMPPEVKGPTGDKPVLAEVMWLVTEEAPWIVGYTFLGVFFLVVLDRRSMRQASWVLVPLVAGLCLTFGVMIAIGWQLNFFNMVVLPAILGIGVDHGVHYYRRWRELGRDTAATQHELFEPVSTCSLTTIMGYAGMMLAHHPGLRSIGNL